MEELIPFIRSEDDTSAGYIPDLVWDWVERFLALVPDTELKSFRLTPGVLGRIY